MKSRMERYYEVESDTSRRTKKNADLYQKIYEKEEYSNIEGIATTLKPNEIDISKIKEMLKNRDDYRKENKEIITRQAQIKTSEDSVSFDNNEEKNYDIRDILNKAKSERKEEENNHHKIDITYDELKEPKKAPTTETEEEELKELIHTITNTSMLNKLGDQDLSLDLLDELKSDTMVGDASAIKAVLEEEKEIAKDNNYLEDDEDDKKNMDKSFFTSSLNFKEKDFDELEEMSNNLKKNNSLMKILIFVLLVVVTATVIFFLLK